MTMDSRQKTMLSVLGVLVVGMGGYWYAMTGGNSDVTKVASGGPSVKHPRLEHVDKVKPKIKHRPGRKPKAAGFRHERERGDAGSANAKNRRKDRGPKEKKKNEPPAS